MENNIKKLNINVPLGENKQIKLTCQFVFAFLKPLEEITNTNSNDILHKCS
jgi:broad specificity polyphosphatase/5'/3'-nucleotidase SurE